MVNRGRIGGKFRSTVFLYRSAVAAVFGLVILLIGIAVSFRSLFAPVGEVISSGWNKLLRDLIPGGSIEISTHILGGILLVLGGYLLWRGTRNFLNKLFSPFATVGDSTGVVDAWRRKKALAMGPRIVAIGGGTGLSTLLRGLKAYSSNITAIVTVSDDGGSSGRLVQELGIIPPGDIRNCLVALADAEKRMTDLFQHRFTASGSLGGHSIGNLLLAAFIEQTGGDVDRALELASEVLAIRGRVIPSTKQHVRLRALMEDGSEICGETSIVSSHHKIRRIFLDHEGAEAHPEAISSILNADLICIGPGSVYTSIIPNLLVPGIPEALQKSQARKAYVCNVMTQRGESDAFTAAEHVVAIQANVSGRVFDYVLVNIGTPSATSLTRYREMKQDLVEPDIIRIKQMGYRPVVGNFMSETDFVRHDPARVAERLMELISR
ncbi:MAG: YvcK family protein [Fimbriimonadaceae bacterium]|jgi:uncharacterized cofD-like protein|nr:YvcK family protein [Fimbriimonadaceae bacterium]